MLTIARVLCPVDLSDASRHALEQAAIVAGWFEASLTVLHVYADVFLPVPPLAMPGYRADVVMGDDERQHLRDVVAQFAESAVTAGLNVDVLVDTGQPVARILERANTERTDLIVMGTHGTSGFEHFILGSVTEKILRKAACPVLTVPPRAPSTLALPFKKILCGVDFSEPSLAALEAALAFAEESDAELTLLHVLDWPAELPAPVSVEAPGFDFSGYRRIVEAEAATRLNALVPADARNWCTPVTRVVHGTPHGEIMKAASADGMDLVVLGVRGRNALDVMVFGSTANQVARHATCPVLTVGRKKGR